MAMVLEDLKGMVAGTCVSGGLDSRTIAKVMMEAGVKVIGFTGGIGQPDEKDINDVAKRMAPTGIETVIVDLRDEMADACLEAVKCQAMYDGGYWNSTGIGRAVTIKGLIPEMKKRGVQVLKVYSPWRDAGLLKKFPGRTQMVDYLAQFGIVAFAGGKKKYSTDANMAGLSHEAEDLESMETSMTIVEPTMGVWPWQAPDKPEQIAIRFSKGRPVQINGKDVTPLEAMMLANEIGGRNGIGMKHALENRIIGTKSRGVYEAPGMELLGSAIRYVYQATMDRRATLFFMQLSKLISDQIYDGRYYDPTTVAARNAVDTLAQYADGTVKLSLYKGNILFDALTDCPHTIYNEADSSMEASDGVNPVSSQGFAEIQSVEARMLALSGQIAGK